MMLIFFEYGLVIGSIKYFMKSDSILSTFYVLSELLRYKLNSLNSQRSYRLKQCCQYLPYVKEINAVKNPLFAKTAVNSSI